MQNFNTDEKTSNEISVQVETKDFFYSQSKPKTSMRLPKNNKIEFKPDLVFPIHKQTKSQFLSISKSHRKRHSAVNHLTNNTGLDKDLPIDNIVKVTNQVDAKKPRRCHSGGFLPDPKQLDRLKICKKGLDHIKEHLDIVYSQPRLEKYPSAFRIPHIYDPLSNFSTRNLPLKPSKYQPKSRVFKNYQACLVEGIDLSLKTGKKLKLKKMKDCKRRYYFRHAPKLASVDFI